MKTGKLNLFAAAIAAVFLISGCGKKEDVSQKTGDQSSSTTQQTGTTAAGSTNKTPGVVIPGKTLAGFFPSIPGYTAKGEPETMEMDMNGTKYSHASQAYENGDKKLKVLFFDYNYMTGLAAGYTAMMNMSMETNEESMHSEKFNGNPGWINWKKTSNEGTVGVVINDRVFAVIEAHNGATIDDAKAAANAINYSAIAAAAK